MITEVRQQPEEKDGKEKTEDFYSEALRLWLYQLPGIGRKTINKLLQSGIYENRLEIAAAFLETRPDRLKDILQETFSERESLSLTEKIQSGRKSDPETLLRELKQKDNRFYDAEHPGFPERLKKIPDPPDGIYVKGRLPDPDRPSIAIIGARTASEYGKQQAGRFAQTLAREGIQIISGMARGIDGIAGRAAVQTGCSFAVLGCGPDVIYPGENEDLYRKLCARGGVLSEYPPGTAADRRLFPARNRIISGLADAVLVIEARISSGTMITVDRAAEQGREVYAVPGRVCDAFSAGCNKLIREGAGCAVSPEALLEDLYGLENRQEETDLLKAKEAALKDILSVGEYRVYRLLSGQDPKSPDELITAWNEESKDHISGAEIMQLLVRLCIMGYAAEYGNGKYLKK